MLFNEVAHHLSPQTCLLPFVSRLLHLKTLGLRERAGKQKPVLITAGRNYFAPLRSILLKKPFWLCRRPPD